MTIPKAIRRAAQLNEGDVIALEIASDHLIVRKVVTGSDKYSCAMQETLGEWTSPEDEEAWGDL
ncbi:MAG: AbrB/MazE/SpoVT family DNA-binding domain-containing protein [Alphaproteobacteria bacterium]|nr:AbrB/MazE/SpoVT family DNA-binding domain-containing protein [Alphaproteobacteria bacterium]